MRDALEDLSAAGIFAVGICPDKPAQQKKFDEKHDLSFPLLSDPEHRIAEPYGMWAEKKRYAKVCMGIARSSFLIDEGGRVAAAWYNISPKNTVPERMKALKD